VSAKRQSDTWSDVVRYLVVDVSNEIQRRRRRQIRWN